MVEWEPPVVYYGVWMQFRGDMTVRVWWNAVSERWRSDMYGRGDDYHEVMSLPRHWEFA